MTEVAGGVFPDAVVIPFVVMVAIDARFYTGLANQVLRFQPLRMKRERVQGYPRPQ